MFDNFDNDDGFEFDPWQQDDPADVDDYLRIDDPFAEDFDEFDAAFALGFADELSQDEHETQEEKCALEYMSLHTNPTRELGRPFENLVQKFIEDLHTGNKKLGDKL